MEGLAFLITSLGGGGAERVVVNLLRAMQEHEPSVILMDPGERCAYEWKGKTHFLSAPLLSGTSPTAKALGLLRAPAQLSRLASREGFRVVVSFLTWPNLVNILSRGKNLSVLSVRNNPSQAIRGRTAPIVKRLLRALYPRAARIVAISEGVRRDLIENFDVPPDLVETIHNPLEVDNVQAAARAPLDPELAELGGRWIVSMGRLHGQKGQWTLIRSFPSLLERVPDAKLVLVGTGPLQDQLVRLSRATGLRTWVSGEESMATQRHQVLFAGFRSNPFPILRRASVFAFPSRWEGLGNVLLEAMACGVPVVSADCPSGPREILAPELPLTTPLRAPHFGSHGVLVPVEREMTLSASAPQRTSEEQWSEVLSSLLTDVDLRAAYVAQGLARAQQFDSTIIAEKWAQLLGSLER